MRLRDSVGFRFRHFSRNVKRCNQTHDFNPQPSQPDNDLLTSQLSAVNKENSALRKEIADHRDANAQQIHSLRQRKSALDARITALSKENHGLKAEMESVTKQQETACAALRSEIASLKRQLADAEQKRDIIKSAVKDLTQELTSITALHAATRQELRVVRREREAALDDAFSVQNLLERERATHEWKEYALQKEIMEARKEYPSRDTYKGDSDALATGYSVQDRITNEAQHEDGDIENPFTTDSLSTEILTPRAESSKHHVLFSPQIPMTPIRAPRAESSKHHVLFSPQIPMTPIRALDDSDYVVKGHGFDSVREAAFAAVEFGRARTDFKMVLNEPFSAWGSAESPTIIYVGFEYPDGTALCYVPMEVRVKYSSTRDSLDKDSGDHGLGADYGRDYVQLLIREEVYTALVEQAKDVFATRYSKEKVELPRVSSEQSSNTGSRLISLTASMKPDAQVERNISSYKQKTLVSKELLDKREDIVGDALLAMRFSKAYPNESAYMLGFKLHGVFVGTR